MLCKDVCKHFGEKKWKIFKPFVALWWNKIFVKLTDSVRKKYCKILCLVSQYVYKNPVEKLVKFVEAINENY